MRNGVCPKCGGNEIIRIPGYMGPYGSGNNIRTSFFSWVKVTRYVCAHCGFSEEWINRQENLDKLKEVYGIRTRKKKDEK